MKRCINHNTMVNVCGNNLGILQSAIIPLEIYNDCFELLDGKSVKTFHISVKNLISRIENIRNENEIN